MHTHIQSYTIMIKVKLLSCALLNHLTYTGAGETHHVHFSFLLLQVDVLLLLTISLLHLTQPTKI